MAFETPQWSALGCNHRGDFHGLSAGKKMNTKVTVQSNPM